MAKAKPGGRRALDGLIACGARSLGPDERYCISKTPEGPLADTASLDFMWPILLFCNALKIDWDDAEEQGYRLAKMNMVTGLEVTD